MLIKKGEKEGERRNASNTHLKMLESRPEDALLKLVKLTDFGDCGDFRDSGDSGDSGDC